ncbi:MAG: isocitrate/isopropylmalate family dehydrogenase [Emticicia sp.]|nr:isocitrate/isopropylmalate family dehydrogenase [Emticicia sp.]
MPFWDKRFAEMEKQYPDIATAQYHIDILCAHFITRPSSFDVVVASNLFGDILSDIGPAVVGGMGIAPGANINPERLFPSMFEPVHGSAPDIAGKNLANPIASIWTASMMLDHLGEKEGAALILKAIEAVVLEGTALTPDLGGKAQTKDVTQAIIKKLK